MTRPTHLRGPMQLLTEASRETVSRMGSTVTLCVLLEPTSTIVTRAADVTCESCLTIIAAVKAAIVEIGIASFTTATPVPTYDRDQRRIADLEAALGEASMLAAFYRSCALSGEDPGDAEEARAKVRDTLAKRSPCPTS